MKRKFAFILIAFIAMLPACKKDPIVNTTDRVGISKVTYYADITLTGSNIISIIKGTSFTDPGVKATAGGEDIPVTTTGTVDASKVGLYTLTYSATNKDGYSSSSARTVIVIPSAETAGTDLSGTYAAVPVGSTPGPANITKVAEGAYYTSNCWGNSGAVIPAYFICVDGSSIIVPNQGSPYGPLETTAPGTYAGGLITWSIDLIGQGGLVRVKKWQKQ